MRIKRVDEIKPLLNMLYFLFCYTLVTIYQYSSLFMYNYYDNDTEKNTWLLQANLTYAVVIFLWL